MRRHWAAALVAAIVLVSPTVLAAPPLSARSISILGDVTVAGSAATLFFVAGKDGASWDATAADVKVVQEWKGYTDVRGITRYDDQPTVTATDLGAATVTSGAFRDGGALLVKLLGAAMESTLASKGRVVATSVHDPRVDEGAPPTVSTTQSSPLPVANSGGPVTYEIHEVVPGSFVNVTADAATIELRGTITLRLYEADYGIASSKGQFEGKTGRFETDATGPASHGRSETDTLTLTDVVLRVRAPSPVTLFSERPIVTFTGALTADDATGALPVAGLRSSAPGAWEGTGSLALAPDADRLLLADPGALATRSAHVALATSPYVWVAVVAGALTAVGVLVALVRRRRFARGDDLEMALLAMEERRWTDALPHLDRVIAARGADPTVLVDRALCCEESGRLEEARAGYEAALRAAPFHAEAHYYYARTLARLRMGTAAMAHLSRALTLDARLAELARSERAFAQFADHPQFIGLVG